MSIMLVLALLLAVNHLDFTVGQIGIAYGINGDNLPPPSQVVDLYKQYGIQRMRIYEPLEATLEALRGSNIELTMSILNDQLPYVASCQANADAWVKKFVTTYTPDVVFKNIVVGNEISPASQNHQLVLPAMRNVITAICSAGLEDQIKVTTSIGTDITEGFPPEEGKFKDDVVPYITPIINLVVSNDAPLFANLFPYFAYKDDYDKEKRIHLQYALLDPCYPGITPAGTNHTYQNLYYALHDTVYTAVGKIVAASPDAGTGGTGHRVHGGESGWPKKRGHKKLGSLVVGDGDGDGDDDEVANIENARKYINNLIQAVKKGTPLRPGRPIPTYIFAMFDENRKTGDEEERNFGLFRPDGTPNYPVNFN